VERSQPVFYYDLGDPECYIAAERVVARALVAEWEPVLGWCPLSTNRGALERRASELGLQPIRWPEPWPPDSHDAMLAATYAKQIGRVVAFSMAAFRQAFAGGRDLGDRDTILIAGAACEMHPSALLKALELRSVAQALKQAGKRARAAGVRSLPALVESAP
jgi:2-hydroxychromene-2-carboxylate isomerase